MIICSFDLGIRNFAFIVVYITPSFHANILLWENIDIHAEKWFDILSNINKLLFDYEFLFSSCDVCLVEKQMKKLNVKATKLSYHVMSFFNIVWPHVKVIEYSASHKTRTFTHQKMTKKERKLHCINHTIEILVSKRDYDNLAHLLCCKKMDDKCDTYQMINSYIEKYLL